MKKDFKDIDLGQPARASEPAVDFAVEEDVETLSADTECCNKYMQFEKTVTLRKPQTKEQWDEWHREAIYEYENGLYCPAEEFLKEFEEEHPWLFK